MDEPAAEDIKEHAEGGAGCDSVTPAAPSEPSSASESPPPSDDALLRRLVCQAQRKLGLDRIVIALLDADRQELREAAIVTATGEAAPGRRTLCSLQDRDNPLAQLALGRRDLFLIPEGGPALTVSAPLRADSTIVGVLTGDDRPTGRPITGDAIQRLRWEADEIALTLRNAALLREAEAERARLDATNRELRTVVAFGRAAASARSGDEVAREIARTMHEGFGYDRAAVYTLDGETAALAAASGSGLDALPPSWTLPEAGPWSRGALGHAEFQFAAGAPSAQSDGGVPHLLLPLRVQRRLLGVIVADNAATGRTITEDDAVQLLAFARQAATAMENVELVETVRESEERLRSLVTSLTETLYSVRISRSIVVPVYYSPQIEELTGYTAEEAMETPDFWREITHPDDRPAVADALAELVKGRSKAVEYRITHRDGSLRWVLDTPVAVPDERGEVTRINGSMLDITERKDLEERLRQAQKMETVGTLAGGIAHDFNNLLAIIKGNLSEAQLDVPRENPATHALVQSQVAVKRAANLVEQLLTFSRTSGASRASLALDTVIRETIPLVQASLGKSYVLDVREEPGVSDVYADAAQMQQVLINLCVNARDAMPDGGTITIRCQNARVRESDRGRPGNLPAGDYVRLQVRDTGAGMDEATRQRIFEPFFTTKPMGRGTGLGLAVTYAIIEEHRGWIEVESVPGEGTVFSVYLPAVETAQGEPSAEVPPHPADAVLVVDEDPASREALAAMLEAHGYIALTAADGSEALAIYWTEGDRIGVVVCADALRTIDCETLAYHLRGSSPHVRIVLSAADPASAARAAEQMGAAGIVYKPYQEIETLDTIRASLQERAIPRAQ